MQAMSDECVMFNFWPYNFNKADSLQFALNFSPACDSWNCVVSCSIRDYLNRNAVRKVGFWYVDKLRILCVLIGADNA